MQVLGSLVHLPPERDALPLPWWHRAPLGLLDRTPVYLALVGTQTRPVGNIVVSVLNPSDWKRMTLVEGQESDKPGVIAEALDAVLPFNIAIAETVTTEAGDQHHVAFVCEPYGVNMPHTPQAHIKKNLAKRGFKGLRPRKFLGSLPQIKWHDVSQVEHGWIWETNWRKQLAKFYPRTLDQVDLERAVVSADTERRLLRFLFPRRNAFSVRIEHADQPGALRQIATIFREFNLNVLSSLLRRGGARPKNALLVVTCEPHAPDSGEGLQESVMQRLGQLPQELRATAVPLKPTQPDELIYSHHPDEIVAHVPSALRPLVRQYKRELPPDKYPIFISRRFLRNERRDRIVNAVYDVLASEGCFPVEATPQPGEFSTSMPQVSAKMWLSRAGIVLVSGPVQQAFSMNLAHEAGFLQGQGKPTLVLVEENSQAGMEGWTNAAGLVAPRFADDETAFDANDKGSLPAILRQWLRSIRTASRHRYD